MTKQFSYVQFDNDKPTLSTMIWINYIKESQKLVTSKYKFQAR